MLTVFFVGDPSFDKQRCDPVINEHICRRFGDKGIYILFQRLQLCCYWKKLSVKSSGDEWLE